MAREIKFRGRHLGKWYYGVVVVRNRDAEVPILIMQNDNLWLPLDIEENCTVGQFTGFHDVNGKEIFEGDILKFTDDGLLCYVDWHKHLRKFYLSFGEKQKENDTKSDIFEMMRMGYKFAIVGNIHDNPELLKRI